MSEDTIVPFVNAAAKRANDNGGLPKMDAIENILQCLEGMQGQIQAMTEVIVQLDKRIALLEKPKRNTILHG